MTWLRLVSVVLAVCAVSDRGFAQEKRPNVLVIFSDDQRADTIAALGNKTIRTPNLDALVKRGVTFRSTYCMGSMQGAVCVPSRAMLLTGRSLFRADPKIVGQTTWPQMFAKAGYRTFAVGKWHNEPPGLLQSFQEAKGIFFGGMAKSPYNVPLASRKDDNTFETKKEARHVAERITDEAVAFLRKQKGNPPFLAYVAYNIPHDPRVAPQKYHEIYAKNPPPAPANFLPVHPFDNGDMTGRDEKLAPWPRTREGVQKELADYYATITFLDDQVGRLVAALKEVGVYENTIIVFASDSGLAIGSHGLFGKQNLYDHSMRSLFILAGPHIPQDTVNDGLTYLYDILPTVAIYAGVEAPEGNEGLMQLRNATPPREAIFTAYRDVQRAVRDQKYHLIVYPKIHRVQLFDLENDPQETKDLVPAGKHAAEVLRLTKLLVAEQERYGDKLPLKVKAPLPEKFEIPNTKGAAVIKGKAGASEIVITTTERTAGAIDSLKWNGKEFLDSTDHGRQLQSASSFGSGGGRFVAETYNPTEAGSLRDGAGPKSTSRLHWIEAKDNVLSSRTQMAFWLAPGEKSDGELARNDRTLSEHVLLKTVKIGAKGLPHAIEYETTFVVPPLEKHTYSQFEAVTGYMPKEFKDFWTLDLKTGKLEPIDDGPGEQHLPLIFSTADGLFAMGVYSPDQPSKGFEKAGYGRWRFKAERVVKWNLVFRLRDNAGVAAGDHTFKAFLAVGTRDEVRDTLLKLATTK